MIQTNEFTLNTRSTTIVDSLHTCFICYRKIKASFIRLIGSNWFLVCIVAILSTELFPELSINFLQIKLFVLQHFEIPSKSICFNSNWIDLKCETFKIHAIVEPLTFKRTVYLSLTSTLAKTVYATVNLNRNTTTFWSLPMKWRLCVRPFFSL